MTLVPNRRTILSAFWVTWACCHLSAAQAQLPRELRVLSYNIHVGRGMDGRLDLPRIADIILAVEPHVVALQEVDQGAARTEHVDQPAELARLTGMKCVFARNIDHDGGGYGTAVLTRLPIKGAEHHRLPSHYQGEQRGVQVVELGAGDDTVVFFATHLDFRGNDGERLASVEKIHAIADSYGDRPMLLVGDLNATPDSTTLARFAERWRSANDQPLATFPAETPT
ncbi:MAG TPA: endonuclease/exonuclease/phosphatase family protein, partial [Lacipirellulaceae bacterium]|nr:endonuclease/exonuclease/phosphatase family protein [Lacipirellulaceae bacterium]